MDWETAASDLLLAAKVAAMIFPPTGAVALALTVAEAAGPAVISAAQALLPILHGSIGSGTVTPAQRAAAETIVAGDEPVFPLEQGEREPWMW